MGPKRKAQSKHRSGRKKWLIALTIFLLVLLVATLAFIWRPDVPADNAQNAPPGLSSLADHYMAVMRNLNSSQTKAAIAAQLGAAYNQTELFAWEKSKLTFGGPTEFSEDPLQILAGGDGICVQWSIVYVSACLAQDYPSRLVAAVDTSTWSYIHTWAEVYVGGRWVHVDPSDGVWDNPSRYQGSSWGWGSQIGGAVRVYAFTDSAYYDVTASYSAK